MFTQKLAVMLFFSLLIPSIAFTSQQADATIDENLYKFDVGFYEKIEQLQLDLQNEKSPSDTREPQAIPTQYVLINVIDGYENQLQGILKDMNAENIFVSTLLDFVSADIPINRISELASFNFIYKLGDEPELELQQDQSLTMSQAKSVVGASNILNLQL